MKTKTTHTPSPWEVEYFTVRSTSPYYRNVCEVAISQTGVNREESEANARLIAAAPELLEVSKRALAELEDCEIQEQSIIEAAQLLRAAIVKVEGK